MDFATEEKLCRLAHEVWRQAAAEPGAAMGCTVRADSADEAGHDVAAALHLQDVYVLDTRDMLCW